MSGYRARDWAVQPPALTPAYKTTRLRAPSAPLVRMSEGCVPESGPVFGHGDLGPLDHDLLQNYASDGAPIGERILLHGRVMDQDARPVPGTLIEIWQANAGGRYRHRNDDYLAPLDPNFGGCGRTLSDDDGHYRFHTLRPGPYPWPNSENSWRPAHIHVSVMGSGLPQRLITQLYFEGDPLVALCPIVQAIPDKGAIDRLVARLDLEAATPFDRLAYRFDIVLRGSRATVFENKPEGM
ncbi:protocatechuate 3,4-dioxygenase subunit beta [Roseovarius phycicola]|uniref:Protocatechuate 3,4-dioxygenase subunit beta n=1 Tax=Roseovarius phycicola TaxID=3080976 RepID=A0ABZ2HJV3_9RHOB